MNIRQYVVPVRTNAEWMRSDREFPYEKPEGTNRILLLGDSISFGFPIAYEKTFGKLLEKALSNTETINASSILAHTARNLEVYEKEGYKYAPDVVILQWLAGSPSEDHMALDQFWGDQFEMRALTEAGYGFWGSLGQDVAGNPTLDVGRLSNSAEALSFLNERIWGNSSWYRKFHWYRFLEINGYTFVLPIKNLLGSYQRVFKNPTSPLGSPMNLGAWEMAVTHTASFEKTLAYVEAFQKTATENGSRFLYVLVPNRIGCNGKFRSEWQKLLIELWNKGIEHVEFFTDFCNADTTPKESLFLEGEIHINEAANAIIAEKIAQVLKNTPR